MIIRIDKRSASSWRVHVDDKFAGVISCRPGPARIPAIAERRADPGFTHDQATAAFLTFGTALGDLIDCLEPVERKPKE